jgi:hypothetical protein
MMTASRSSRRKDPFKRYAEWLMIRRTGRLGDLVDEQTFMRMAGCKVETFRKWALNGGVFGIEFPEPIIIPEGQKCLWFRPEVEGFVRKYKAKKNIGRR